MNNRRRILLFFFLRLFFLAVETAFIFIGGQIVGIRRSGKDILSPTPDARLQMGDKLLVIHVQETKAQFFREQSQEIILVDDNPIIRRLYTRLFQKAGYNLMTAGTGGGMLRPDPG